MQETWVRSLGWEDPLENEWQPTPVFLPGESHGLKSLAGFSPLGRKESDMTEKLRHTRKCTCGNKEAVPDIGKIMSKDRELEDSLKMFSGS